MKKRVTNPQFALRPQDLMVLLKLCLYHGEADLSYRQLEAQLGISKSEANEAVRRLERASLVQGLEHPKPLRDAVSEFVIHGARYAFPPVRGETTRGMVTAWGASPLRVEISQQGEPPPVWPDPQGDARGPALYPLYPSVPLAARNDAALYELLALFDALREGRARERGLAQTMLAERLK